MTVCAPCKRPFTGVTAFDKHQSQSGSKVTCHNPADVGLVMRDTGKWGLPVPEGMERPEHWTKPAGETKVFNCRTCNKPFKNTPGRGRPPVNCRNCGGKGIPIDEA